MLQCSDAACRLDGKITVDTAGQLFNELKPFIEKGISTLDFSNVTEVDSSVLALMLSCLREASQRDRDLHFSGLSKKITTLADLYGVGFFLSA